MRDDKLELACLCAAWCHLCAGYAVTIKAVAAEFDDLTLRWIDIEDEAELLGDVDVETFPTLLLRRGAQLLFAGPVQPQAEHLRRLLAAARDGQLAMPHAPPEVHALVQRLGRHPVR